LLTTPSRPGDLHPEPLTDPDVNLSIHPARATTEKAAAFRLDKELLRLPVDSIPTWVTCPLRSAGVTLPPRYYETVRPCPRCLPTKRVDMVALGLAIIAQLDPY
jgi:hypothetical protein